MNVNFSQLTCRPARFFLLIAILLISGVDLQAGQPPPVQRYLYVVCPGIRNYPEFGGAGILVFDINRNHKFVKRIATPASQEPEPDNIKGVCASAVTGRLYFTTRSKLYCVDLRTDQTLWEKALPQGTDRMSITPDGKILYVPSLEKDIWNVVDAKTGDVITAIETKSGSHNTVVGLDGTRMYLGGLKSPHLFVAETHTHQIVKKVGPFSGAIRPFTVNGKQTRAYICVNDLLGFEVGDLEKGTRLYRVEVAGFQKGPVKRHGCPSHGIGLTPDEKEIWVVDAFNQKVHVFDNTVDPPKQKESIAVREQPGWVTFSVDGTFAYPSTGEVIHTGTKKILTALTDEKNRPVHSEKMVEVHLMGNDPVRVGDQFGIGREKVEYLLNKDKQTRAAIVGEFPLMYTSQVLSSQGNAPIEKHIESAFGTLNEILRMSDAGPVLRLSVVATSQENALQVHQAIHKRYPAGKVPPVTYVVGQLPAGSHVAVDAVAVASQPSARVGLCEGIPNTYGPHTAVLPAGPKVFISGQAEKGATPAEAAAKTIASLKKTLEWLGSKPEDAVQAKCFLTPMDSIDDVMKEFDKAFGPGKLPVIFVEWKSTLPIEIELVAKAPAGKPEAGAMEFLTPPGMTASPVYCRVARVNRGNLVFTTGLWAKKAGNGEEQVLDIFNEVKDILEKSGSGFQNLAKATYYVSDDDPSRKLNELRPRFYDPKRPPAASKAVVSGVGQKDRGITLDLIAVAEKK